MPGRRTAAALIATITVVVACSVVVDTSGLSGGTTAPDEARPLGEGGLPIGETGAGETGSDSGPDAGPPPPPPSCATGGPGTTDCGPNRESCCVSPVVSGGVYKRGHDGVILFDVDHPAQISAFRLDRFEVTVGRFRAFVSAVSSGFTPAAGAGKHVHLNGGAGLAAIGGPPGSPKEPGWDSALTAQLPRTALGWATSLSCHASFQTWTSAPGPNEQRPINCVSWPEAYAFCIWDGGFLPSETEAAYAEQGGAEQRVYPWSSPPTSQTIDCTYANIAGCVGGASTTNAVGTESPKGDGRWQQTDLLGNVREWALDIYADGYPNPCVDCVVLSGTPEHATHGSGYFNIPAGSAGGFRGSAPGRDFAVGMRCARTP